MKQKVVWTSQLEWFILGEFNSYPVIIKGCSATVKLLTPYCIMNFSLHPAHSISCQKKRRSESHRENAQNPEPYYVIKCMMNIAVKNVICEQLQIIPISGHKTHSSNNAHLHQLWCLRSLHIIHPEESYNRPLWKTLAFAAHQTIHSKKSYSKQTDSTGHFTENAMLVVSHVEPHKFEWLS